MANFGGPDPNMSAQLIGVLQRKQDRRIEGIKAIGDGVVQGMKLYQAGQELEMRKEEHALKVKESPIRMESMMADADLKFMELKIKSMELERLRKGVFVVASLGAEPEPGAADLYYSTLSELEEVNGLLRKHEQTYGGVK